MQKFQSKWGEVVSRVLATYPPGSPGLITALETLCRTAEQEGEAKGRAATAVNVCEGLHEGPPNGIKCLSCYHVEVNYTEELVVQSEIDAARREEAVLDEKKDNPYFIVEE
jgi:hypothetical protein